MILRPPEHCLYENMFRDINLNEEKSIADEVKALTKVLADTLKQDLSRNGMYYYGETRKKAHSFRGGINCKKMDKNLEDTGKVCNFAERNGWGVDHCRRGGKTDACVRSPDDGRIPYPLGMGVRQETYPPRGVRLPYKCNTEGIDIDLTPLWGVQKTVKFFYKVYLLESKMQNYKNSYAYAYNNSGVESDFDKGFIRLTTFMVDGELSFGWVSELQHEVSHYFQSFKGQKKNDTLYKQVVDLVRSGDENKANVGWTLYYTFPTEQDAFANQFYAWLMQGGNKGKNPSFSDLLDNTAYRQFREVAANAEAKGENPINKIVRTLGFDNRKYRRRVSAADKRFQKKMWNAYNKYLIDSEKENIYESVIPYEKLTDKKFFTENFLTNKHLDFNYCLLV